MFPSERRAKILQAINDKGHLDVNTLADKVGVSRETIRRDLKAMELEGLLKRARGGAIACEDIGSGYEMPVSFRATFHPELKDSLCKKAASFIKEGDLIIIDNSSTALGLIKYLPKEYHLTIITNSIQCLLQYYECGKHNWTCVSLGGILREKTFSTFGYIAEQALAQFRPNKVFISCTGINADYQVTDGTIDEFSLKQNMVRLGQEVFLLIDKTKFNKSGIIALCDVSDVDYIITNASLDAEQAEFIGKCNTKVIYAED